ncbi:unnamed protein product [Amoebophrya sp. A120]|nr:unnamed protein product [Amoebophrya sp. A120]|eukprot:GSA120T00003517001.1
MEPSLLPPITALEECVHTGRCFVQSKEVSLEWYEKVIHRMGMGSILDDSHLVFDRQEMAFLREKKLISEQGTAKKAAGTAGASASASSSSSSRAARQDVDASAGATVPSPPKRSKKSPGKELHDEIEVPDRVTTSSERCTMSFVEISRKNRNSVYAMLKERGYIVRSGLKFGVDFLVYEGSGQGKNHAKFAVLVDHGGTFDAKAHGENHTHHLTTWGTVAAKSRLCTSVGKKLCMINAKTGKGWVFNRWKY